MGPVSIGVEVQRKTGGDTPSNCLPSNYLTVRPVIVASILQKNMNHATRLRLINWWYSINNRRSKLDIRSYLQVDFIA